VSKLAIQQAIGWICIEYDLDFATIAGIATLDRKINEPGLVDSCRESGLFLKTYRPERLNSVTIERSSPLVLAVVATASVAEAAALCAAQTQILLIPKQKFRLDPQSGWVTIAIASAE
jgi:cobalt-precorrin 5A hydrolase